MKGNFNRFILKKTFYILFLTSAAYSSPYMNQGFYKQPVAVASPHLAFTNAVLPTVSTWLCRPLDVQTRNAANVATNVVVDTTISLTGSVGVHYYSDSACKIEVSSVVVTAGSNHRNFYFMSGKLNPASSLTAANVGYNSATQIHNVASYLGCTWLGGTSNWETAGNWSCGHIPTTTAGDIAVFDSNCSNCSPDRPTSMQTPYGLWLTKDFSSTVKLTSTAAMSTTVQAGGSCRIDSGTLTIGTGDFNCNGAFYQSGGTFDGVSSAITLASLSISGGSFKSTSATLNLTGALTITNAPIFDANSGVFQFSSNAVINTITPGNLNFYDVSFESYNGDYTLTGTLNVTRHLRLDETSNVLGWGGQKINGGTIAVGGDIFADNYGLSGTTLIQVIGNPAGQTISSSTTIFTLGSPMPGLQILAGANPVTFGPVVSIKGSYEVSSVGTFNNLAGTLHVYGDNTIKNFKPGPYSYNDVVINGYFPVFEMGNQTLDVLGTLTFQSDSPVPYSNQINSGFINAYGNVVVDSGGYYLSTAILTIAGNIAGQSVTGSGGAIPHMIVAAGTNPVDFVGSFIVGGNYTYSSSGTFTTTGNTLGIYANTQPVTIVPGPVHYNDVVLRGDQTDFDLSSGTMLIDGTLAVGDALPGHTINNGTLKVSGDITVYIEGYVGSGLLVMASQPGGQTIRFDSPGVIPNLEIAAGTNPVTLSGIITVSDYYKATSVGTFTTTGSTLQFLPGANVTTSITAGTENYNNIEFAGDNGGFDLNGTTINIDGLLSVSDNGFLNLPINNGILKLKGNAQFTGTGKTGTVQMQFVGGNQSLGKTALTSLPTGNILINNTGTLTLGGNVVWSTVGQTVTMTTGAINMSNRNLTIKSLSMAAGTSITRGTGTLKVNGVVIGAGPYGSGTIF